MPQMTDRVTDSKLIELAKQKYNQTQITKIPGQIVHLTSKGLVYPTTSLLRKGYVEMRHMTAYDEDILTNASYIQQGIVFDKLLASLIIDDIDVNDIAACDKDGLIINARVLGYGSEYNVSVTDPNTNKTIQAGINLTGLQTKEFLLIPDDLGEFDYAVNSTTKIKFKYPTSGEISSIKETNSVSGLLELIITEINDKRDFHDIQNFIRYELRAIDAKKLREFVSVNSPEIIKEWIFESEVGGTFTSVFRFDSGLFWS
jgi:hypothetical protein